MAIVLSLGCKQLPSHYVLNGRKREREREERARERESKSYMENSGKDMNVLKKDQKTLDLHSIPYEYICLY